MADPLTFTLESNKPTDGWRPADSSDPHCEITGSGSCTITLEYECVDGSYAPNATGVDGGTPIILGRLSYVGSPIRLSLQPGRKVRVSPGAVSGTVKTTFVES